MFPGDIQIGTRLELEILVDDERIQGPYVSQFLELQDDGNIVISTPIYEARLLYIPINTGLRLSFINAKNGLYGFTASLIKHDLRDNLSVLLVRPTSELLKIQRRTNFRLDYSANVSIKVNKNLDFTEESPEIKARTKNISGSGLCVISDIELPKGTDITVELHLPKNTKIIVKSFVVRCESFVIRKVRSYNLGLHFYDISSKDRETLIKFIFEQQRLLLKKGVF